MNVEITLADLQAALVATGNTGITIKSQDNGNTSYIGGRWRGTLNSLDVALMYRVKVTEACEITLEGMPVDPAEHPVTIPGNGSKWIAFPIGESMTVTNAFAGFAVNGDELKSQSDGSTKYTGGRWRGTLGTLDPGKGHIYKSASSADRVLTFPSSAK